MGRTFFILSLSLIAATAIGGSRHRWDGGVSCGVCVSPMVDDVNDCGDLHVIVNDRDAVRAEENVPADGIRSLRIHVPESGGVYVRQSSGSRYSIKACKAAELGESLGDVHVSVSGDEVTATGPHSKQWLVYFIVEMPRGGHADFQTSNGPISVFGVDAVVTARAENGPISFKESFGTLHATAQNGPISVSGSSGDVTLRTENGPISVKLREMSWTGGRLDARTDNGPLSVEIPRGYRSGVTVDTDGNSPVRCRAEDCRNGRIKFGDDDESRWPRHIDLGSGPHAVTVATSNGPVSINER
jgi:hypothetical protein